MSGDDEEALAEAYNRGLDLEKAGEPELAAEAYREALAIDPDDPGGVSIRLAAMGFGPMPESMPVAYVATLFDQHADDFDDILVDRLGYCVPMQLRQMLRNKGIEAVDRALDLGCGTGLSGVALQDCAAHLIGVDLSERIVELAFDRDVYDELYVGEAVTFLREFRDEADDMVCWDLIVATDVFPYLGRIEPIVSAAAARLTPGGYFGFSTETMPDASFEDAPYLVVATRRFAHSRAYVGDTLSAAGFEIVALEDITVRLEEGEPVPGHLVLAQRTA